MVRRERPPSFHLDTAGARGSGSEPPAESQPAPYPESAPRCRAQAAQPSGPRRELAEPFWNKLHQHLHELGLGTVGELEVSRLRVARARAPGCREQLQAGDGLLGAAVPGPSFPLP